MGFFDDLLGKSQRKEIQAANAAATKALDTSYSQGTDYLRQAGDQATGYLSPWASSGGGANALLGNYLGANGADAQRQAFANFQRDPGWQAQYQAGIGALDSSASARGGIYSGGAMRGLANYGQQFQRQAYNDRVAQLGQLSGQGMQAAGQQAGVSSNMGNALSNLAGQYGQNTATNAINYGNAMAQSRTSGVQNVISGLATIGGMAMSAFAPGAGGMSAAGGMGNALMRGMNGASGGGVGFPTSGGWSTSPSSWTAYTGA